VNVGVDADGFDPEREVENQVGGFSSDSGKLQQRFSGLGDRIVFGFEEPGDRQDLLGFGVVETNRKNDGGQLFLR
jgi:hypothetical protein